MEYKTQCGCIVVQSPPNFRIKYCPKHDAASDLYEALKELRAVYADLIDSSRPLDFWVKVDKALAKADRK